MHQISANWIVTCMSLSTGTYVFRLNDHFLVDATRAGNIAHLINHSCAPCCVSKAYTIQCPQTGERKDHVVIVAKRDIAVGKYSIALDCTVLESTVTSKQDLQLS